MIKRIIATVLILSMLIVLSACVGKVKETDKISIVCTTFAAYDWTREIVDDKKERFDLALLGDGVDLHSFQPTTKDIAKIHTADLIVQIGGKSEEWLNDLELKDKTLKLFDLLGDTEKICAGKEHIGHNHSDEEYDEHIWLSLGRPERMVIAICERICDLDKENGVEYQKNCAEYTKKLKNLSEKYRSAVQNSKDKTVIFADRYPFAYMMFDCGINCISAFDGCSSDTNASFEIIANLAENIKKYNKDTVLILENSSESVAVPLKAALDGKVIDTAIMNSCQTISVSQDTSYIEIMTDNLESLKKALR